MTNIDHNRFRLFALHANKTTQADDLLRLRAATLSKLTATLHQALNTEPLAMQQPVIDWNAFDIASLRALDSRQKAAVDSDVGVGVGVGDPILEVPVGDTDLEGAPNEDGGPVVGDPSIGLVPPPEDDDSGMPSDPAGGGRRLDAIDGVVGGNTTAEHAADAGAERVAVIWQALMTELNGQPPKLSAADAIAFTTGLYLGGDVSFSAETWGDFFDKNVGADGTLASTLDVSMFEGVDPGTMRTALGDASALFHAAQQSHIRAQSGDTRFEPSALTLADDPAAAQGAFVRALRNDMLQTGTSDYLTHRVDTGNAQADALTNSHSQDFSVTGISHEAIVNGVVTEDDLANHAGVKALLFTGNEVMAELIAQGLWDGPTLAQLDSTALTTDPALAVYQVSYTLASGGQTVTTLVTKSELDALVAQDKAGTIALHRGTVDAAYIDDISANPLEPTATFGYSITYVDEAGVVQTDAGTNRADYDALIASDKAGKIQIINPAISDVPTLKVFWAQQALVKYDATRTQIYDASGNVVSGQSAEIRLAQNYYQQYHHFEGATQTSSFHNRIGQARTGTSIVPLLDNAPIAATPQVSDSQALAFLYEKMGVVSEEQNLSGFLRGLGAVSDTAELAGHWAQAENNHPDHSTVFLGFGGHHGNKEQARTVVGASQDALAQRGRYDPDAVGNAASGLGTALTQVEMDITTARVFDGVFDVATVLSLGADTAALGGFESLLQRAGVGEVSELAASALSSAERNGLVNIEALANRLVVTGDLTRAQADRIIATSAGASTQFWAEQGANGLKYAAAGTIEHQVLQGSGANVIEIAPAQTETLDPSETAGLDPRAHAAAIRQAQTLLEMRANGASVADMAAFLYGEPGTDKANNAALIEQTLELLPADLRAQLTSHHQIGLDDYILMTLLIARGNAQEMADFIETKGSPAEQWSAFNNLYEAGLKVGAPASRMVDVLAALSPEVAAAVVSYEQASILNGANPTYGNAEQPLYTAGPALAALITLAQGPEADEAGAILLSIGQTAPGIGAHLLLTAIDYAGSTDGGAKNHALASTLLGSVIKLGDAGATAAGNMLAALDGIEYLHGPRRLSGATDFGLALPDLASLPILDNLWANLDVTSPTSLSLMAGATAAYVASSGYVTWQDLGNRVTSLVAGAPTPSQGLQAYEQFLNSPFDTFREKGAILGAVALDNYGTYNAAELLIDMPAIEAADNLQRVGTQRAAELFQEIAQQSPAAAANIIVIALGPESPFDDGAAQVQEWSKATEPSTLSELTEDAYQSPELTRDTTQRDNVDKTMAMLVSNMAPADGARFLKGLSPENAARLVGLMVKDGKADKAAAFLDAMTQMDSTGVGAAAAAAIITAATIEERVALVRGMTPTLALQALRQMPLATAREIFMQLTPAEAAGILQEMNIEEATSILLLTPGTRAAAILLEMDTFIAVDILERMTPAQAAAIMGLMTPAQAANFLTAMNAQRASEIFSAMPLNQASQIVISMDAEDAVSILDELDSFAASDILEAMTPTEAAVLLTAMDAERAGAILVLIDAQTAAIVLSMTPAQAAAIFDEMTSDEVVVILEEMDAAQAAAILIRIDGDLRAEILMALDPQRRAAIEAAMAQLTG